jgi:hypothetical protein
VCHRPPASPGGGTISPAVAAAPAGAAFSRHKVDGYEFVAVAAAAWRQYDPPGRVSEAKSGNIEQLHSTPPIGIEAAGRRQRHFLDPNVTSTERSGLSPGHHKPRARYHMSLGP